MKYYLSHGGEVPVMGITPDGEYPVINGEKGLVGNLPARSFSQSGGLFLEELKGGESHNIVPASAFAQIRCSKEQAEQIAGLEAEKIFCTPGESGIRIGSLGKKRSRRNSLGGRRNLCHRPAVAFLKRTSF